jgi:peptidyl-prolyl cis-trans isomerase A (cyclophilin A)
MALTRRTVLAGAASAAGLAGSARSQEKKSKNPVVVFDTTQGEIHVEMNPEKAPGTVKNFVEYVKAKHFDGLVFHRVIPDFMIQGGGFTAEMMERKTRAPIRNEAGNGLKNDRGTIAMARTPNPDSATAQFFINLKNNDFLNHRDETPQGFGYAVFGKVVKGMEVVDKIAKVRTGDRDGHQNVPVEPVVIRTAKVQEPEKKP